MRVDTVGAEAATGMDTGARVCGTTMDTAGESVGAADTSREWDGAAAETVGAADTDAGARTSRTVAGADAGQLEHEQVEHGEMARGGARPAGQVELSLIHI